MTRSSRPWYSVLYVQVLIAIVLGVVIGSYFPKTGVALKPLGDGFIALTNLIGNGVATIVIGRWEGKLDVDKQHETMAHPITVGEELEEQTI